jgi:DMSO/TMAO reductase YedYZ heme-binding membrane subunit
MARKPPFAGNIRLILQIKAIALSLVILAIPPVVVFTSGTATADATWTALRIAALLAFSLIFLNIVTGSFRPVFNRIFKARTVQRVHVATGLAGFSLALAHGILVAIYGLTGYKTSAVAIGPTVLVLLFITILTAITRRRIKQMWRWIHRLNYLIFAAVFVHALILGYDLKNEVFIKIVFIIYAVVVAAGLIFRLATDKSWRTLPGKAKQKADEKE